MAALSDGVTIRPKHWAQMQEHVARLDPEEACGIVAGKDTISKRVYRVENALHSLVRFRMAPQQQVDAILDIEKKGWDCLAIFHSHPAGPPTPSPTDVAEAAYPEAINLIWWKQNGEWTCRGFLIQEHRIEEIVIRIAKP